MGDRVRIGTGQNRWTCVLNRDAKVRKNFMCKDIQAIYHGNKASHKAEGLIGVETKKTGRRPLKEFYSCP